MSLNPVHVESKFTVTGEKIGPFFNPEVKNFTFSGTGIRNTNNIVRLLIWLGDINETPPEIITGISWSELEELGGGNEYKTFTAPYSFWFFLYCPLFESEFKTYVSGGWYVV